MSPDDQNYAKSALSGAYKDAQSAFGRIFSRLRKLVVGLLAFMGLMFVAAIVMIGWSANEFAKNAQSAKPAHNDIVLFWPLETALPDAALQPSFSRPFNAGQFTTHELVMALDRAVRDPRVKAFVVSYRGGGISLSQAQEITVAVDRMRAAGKKTLFYSADMAANASGLPPYLLASSFENIWLMPTASLAITGIRAEIPYAKNLLDRMGMQADFMQRKEYKNAFESLTSDHMTPESREANTAMLGSLFTQGVAHIASNRKLTPAQVNNAVNEGLLTAEEAKTYGLITEIGYGDDAVAFLKKQITDAANPVFVRVADYIAEEQPSAFQKFAKLSSQSAKDKQAEGGAVIDDANGAALAVVRIDGTLTLTSESGGTMGAAPADATDIAQAIMGAGKDPAVKGILLAVNSPGGTPAAAETVRNAVRKAKADGKRIYVSMGALAASGGYWLAADADRIYALPGTLTGSIGVVGGKFVLGNVWDKLDIKWETIGFGNNAGLWSTLRPFSESERAVFAKGLDQTYSQFITRVAEGRKMSLEQVEAVAKGRVWTGEQAAKNGLVDELGGYYVALSALAKDTGFENLQQARIITLPAEENPLVALMKLFGLQSNVQVIAPVNSVVPQATGLYALQQALHEGGVRGAVVAPELLFMTGI